MSTTTSSLDAQTACTEARSLSSLAREIRLISGNDNNSSTNNAGDIIIVLTILGLDCPRPCVSLCPFRYHFRVKKGRVNRINKINNKIVSMTIAPYLLAIKLLGMPEEQSYQISDPVNTLCASWHQRQLSLAQNPELYSMKYASLPTCAPIDSHNIKIFHFQEAPIEDLDGTTPTHTKAFRRV